MNIHPLSSPRSLARFLRLGVITLIVPPAVNAELPNRVAAGDTTQDSAVLWTRTTQPGEVKFEVSTDRNFAAPGIIQNVLATESAVPVKLDLNGLTPGTTYYYRATDASGAAATGRFKTNAAAGSYSGLRFGVSGDWRGELAPYPAVSNAPERNLDFFVALGDTIYADFPSPALPKAQAQTLSEFRTKHSEVYGERGGANTLAALRASTTTFATIDDHEVTNDFQGGAPVSTDPRFGQPAAPGQLINDALLYEDGMRAFQEYNPLRTERYGETGDERTAGELKLYRSRTFGNDASLHLLDARSFRDSGLPEVTDLNDPAQVGGYLAASFDPDRTMLGRQQVTDLKEDLKQAQESGVTWKFVALPEPIQNLGVLGASDRYEGYAAERTEILKFIDVEGIENVVFIAADIHGTLVNNLTYQNGPFQPQIATSAFEITTGAVAFDAPFGPTVARLAFAAGLISPAQYAFYLSLPSAPDPDQVPNDQDDFIKGLINTSLAAFGYDPLGLNQNLPMGNLINSQLLRGDYEVTGAYGWTEFEIDPLTQSLLVTTYGVSNYTAEEALTSPEALMRRSPQILSQFVVAPTLGTPVPEPASFTAFAALATLALIYGRFHRRRRTAGNTLSRS